MVQIFETEDPRGKLSGLLGMSLGTGIGNGLNTFFANRSLDSVLQDKSLDKAAPSERMTRLHQALAPYGETGMNLLSQRMGIEQQAMQEREQGVLGKVLAGKPVSEQEFAGLSPQNQIKVMDISKRKQAGMSLHKALVDAGYPEETANIWKEAYESAPVGGQSAIVKDISDLIRRSPSGKGLQEEQQKSPTLRPTIEVPGTDSGELELDFPKLPEPVGMTPADIVKQNEYREKTNIPLYNEAVDRGNALDDEYREVKHLQELNETGKLPTGLSKWNVNWETGDLLVKALSTPEAEDYVKTIARMARRAKDFFPGRVTNFDLDQFKAGFPTLANSPEGRRIIAQQLALGNRIAYLKDETYKAAMDHYGSGADPVLIKKYATANYRRLKSQLEDQLKQVNSQAQSVIAGEDDEVGGIDIENATTLEELFP